VLNESAPRPTQLEPLELLVNVTQRGHHFVSHGELRSISGSVFGGQARISSRAVLPCAAPSNAMKRRGLVAHPRWGNDGSWRIVLKKSAICSDPRSDMRPAGNMEAAGIELTERNRVGSFSTKIGHSYHVRSTRDSDRRADVPFGSFVPTAKISCLTRSHRRPRRCETA
jgi:hypothetical protein